MSEPMALATWEDRKTQTRRIVKNQPGDHFLEVEEPSPGIVRFSGDNPTNYGGEVQMNDWSCQVVCPYGVHGDQLWVRETYIRGGNGQPLYCAGADREVLGRAWENGFRKTPSIFMRRWESRMSLEITAVRVERLQDISEEDAKAEGVTLGEDRSHSFAEHGLKYLPYTMAYEILWEHINGAGSWALNPWVWCISFKRIKA